MVEQILVHFHGEGSGVDELTWSQQAVWQAMQGSGHTLAIGGLMPLPEGTTVDEAVTVLRYVMSRHQSLRTRVAFAEDGRPLQVVAESGETVLEIVDAADEAGAAEAAEAMRARYEDTNFDCANDWPLRMGAVRCRGALTHAVAIYCHLAIDGPGLAALTADLANLDRTTGRQLTPVAGLRPLELARHQRSPAALRHSDAALRHWERQLRAIPSRRDTQPTERGPYYWHLDCRSQAMNLALRSIAARTRVDTGHVLLAAYAMTLAHITATNPIAIQVLVSNRFRPGHAESVSHLTQTGLVVIDVATGTFDEVVARAWKASMAASMYGYYDTAKQSEMYQRVCQERGEELDIPCFFNDRRTQSRQAMTEAPPTPRQVRAALPRTELHWREQRDWFGGLFFLHVNEATDVLDLTAWGNVRGLSRTDLAAHLRRLETILVDAALGGEVSTAVSGERALA